MTTKAKEKPHFPIFDHYTIDELARRLARSEAYLVDMKTGNRPVPPKFRQMAAAILNQTEAELFGADGTEG